MDEIGSFPPLDGLESPPGRLESSPQSWATGWLSGGVGHQKFQKFRLFPLVQAPLICGIDSKL
jgi:hypothetical protein